MTTTLRVVSAVAIAVAAIIGGPGAQGAFGQQRFQYIGPKQCTNCHDHDNEKLWYEKKEIPEVHRLFPDQNNAGHINSLKQLEAQKSDEYAKAIGLADKYDAAGACVTCHATVFGGEANAGVSCESCHGPGSGYKDPHQTKDSYEKSVTQFGMTKLVGNFAGWTQQCTNCHVMTEEKLIAAGHPSGDDFDLSKKFVPVSIHFKKKYEAEDVAAIAKGEMQAVLRRRGRAAPTATNAAATPAAGSTTATSAPASAAAPAETPAAAAPTASSAAAPASAAPTSSGAPSSAAPSSTGAPAANTGRPRPAARPAPVDPASPPAGSPTSIEPPPPAATAAPGAAAPSSSPPAAAPSSTASSTPPAPAVAVTTTGAGQYVWAGAGIVVLAIVIAAVVIARKRR
jgi:hypothetical protein